ncbi:MAG: hemolysin family protein [Ignavibacteriota bacterium]
MSYSPFPLLLVVLLIAVNGFFAGAEVALLSVRPSRLRQMSEDGQAGAQAAMSLLAHPGRLLSLTQVGVTLASLGLGWAGEDTLYRILIAAVHPVTTPLSAKFLHAGCLIVSFLAISYFHVVLGEVVPKNLAISKADRLAALVAPPLLLFMRISVPFVVTIERSASAITRALRIHSASHGGGHSAEELKLIVSSSRGLGYLPEAQEDMIHRVLDLGEVAVREIMVARNDIVSVSCDSTLDEVLVSMIREQHSRLPVYEGAPEKIVGILPLQGSSAGVGGAPPVDPYRPRATRIPREPSLAPTPGGCRRPSRFRRCWKNSAKGVRTWRWWSTNSAPS